MTCEDFKERLVKKDSLDGASSGEALSHAKECPSCGGLLEIDSRLEGLIAHAMLDEEPPAGLVERVDYNIRSMEDRGAKASRLKPIAKVLIPFAGAAMLLVFMAYPSSTFKSPQELAALAVENHLSDLTIKFTAEDVKDVPGWFAGKLGFAFTMPDLEGFDLIGGRKCSLGRKDVAYLFYRDKRKDKRVSVFVLDSRDIDFDLEKNTSENLKGTDVRFWKAGETAYVMVE